MSERQSVISSLFIFFACACMAVTDLLLRHSLFVWDMHCIFALLGNMEDKSSGRKRRFDDICRFIKLDFNRGSCIINMCQFEPTTSHFCNTIWQQSAIGTTTKNNAYDTYDIYHIWKHNKWWILYAWYDIYVCGFVLLCFALTILSNFSGLRRSIFFIYPSDDSRKFGYRFWNKDQNPHYCDVTRCYSVLDDW